MLAEREYHEGERVPRAYRHNGGHGGDQKVSQPIAGVCFLLGPSSHHAEPPVYRQVDGDRQREERRRRLQDRAEPAVNSDDSGDPGAVHRLHAQQVASKADLVAYPSA